MAGQCFGKRNILRLDLKGKGKVIPCKRDEDGKGPETYRTKSGIQGIWGLRVSAEWRVGEGV